MSRIGRTMKLNRIAFSIAKFYNAVGVRKALGEDFRKIGTAAIGVSVVTFYIPQVKVSLTAPLWLGVVGIIMWGMGLVLTHSSELRAEQEQTEVSQRSIQEKNDG